MLPTDPGFDPNVSFVIVSLRGNRHPDLAQRHGLMAELRRQAEGIAGVEQAALADDLPFGGTVSFAYAEVAGQRTRLYARSVSPQFFTVMQIPLTAGRLFEDGPGAQGVLDVVVNQALARKLSPSGDSLGLTLPLELEDGAHRLARVVGVASDVRSSARRSQPRDEIYLPYSASDARRAYVLARAGAVPPSALGPALFDRARATAPTVPLEPAQTLNDLLSRSVSEPRFQVSLVGAFSANALLLAAIGVFGSVAYALSSRRRELGIRAAVGASPAALAREVVTSTAFAMLAGLTGGVLAAAGLGKALAAEINGVQAYDPTVLALAAAVLGLSAFAAAAAPARSASHIAPVEALRHE
jgi:hypothetical protein